MNSVLTDMYLTPLFARTVESGGRTRRRIAALLEQCRRLRAQLNGALGAYHRNDIQLRDRIATCEAALRDIANHEECTTYYACQRRARQALERG
jgi:hypothetical protein